MTFLSYFDRIFYSLTLIAFWMLFCLVAIPTTILADACYTLTRCFLVDQQNLRVYRVIPTPERQAASGLFRA